MPSRKRVYDEVDSEDSIPTELSTLQRIRGMWEFAAFMQYLFFFGKAIKVDDLDVEVRTLQSCISSRERSSSVGGVLMRVYPGL